MPLAIQTAPASSSKVSLWAGRILSGLMVAFLIFDGVTKIIKEHHVMDAFARFGYPARLAPIIGTILIACVAVYVVPRSSFLGAILLTGYLGGATEFNMRAGNPPFETLFPVIFGVLVWLGVFLRDKRLRELLPLRSPTADS
ncbi:MAG: DoxX family protein [Terriglobales bacterium]